MRTTVGYFTLLAAIVLIGCSASSLFWSAYDGAVDPWQKWIQGTQIVAVIIWEAGAVIAITYCFSHGYKIIGYAGTVLLILAMGYTLSEELRQQAGAQETAMSKREAQKGKLELVRSELDKAIARRDELQKLRKPNEGQQDELTAIRGEIAKMKDKWEAQIDAPHTVVPPGVALIARWTKMNVTDSADLQPLVKMAFWTMARVFALPIAMFGISLLGVVTLTVQAAKARDATPAPVVVQTPLSVRPRAPLEPRKDVLAIMAANYPKISDSSPPHPPKPDDTPPPGDKAPVAEPEVPVEKVAAKLELVTDGGKSVPKSLEPEKPNEKVAQKVVDFPTKIKRAKYRKVAPNKHGKVGRVVDWLGETATQTPDVKVRVSSEDCYENYEIWCGLQGLYAVPWRTFTKKLTAQLRIKNPERNSKNGQRMFPLLLTDPSQWQQKRKVRAA